MKNTFILSLLSFLFCTITSIAQPQLENEIPNAQTSLPNWVPQIGDSGTDPCCFLDYDGDGHREIISWELQGDNYCLTATNGNDLNYTWTFPTCFTATDDLWQWRKFLGFFDIDGDGNKDALVGLGQAPIAQNGFSHLSFASANPDSTEHLFDSNLVLKSIRDQDNDGLLEIILQNPSTNTIELWGQ